MYFTKSCKSTFVCFSHSFEAWLRPVRTETCSIINTGTQLFRCVLDYLHYKKVTQQDVYLKNYLKTSHPLHGLTSRLTNSIKFIPYFTFLMPTFRYISTPDGKLQKNIFTEATLTICTIQNDTPKIYIFLHLLQYVISEFRIRRVFFCHISQIPASSMLISGYWV
jgi:hypothetical protein